jgi:CRP/FNR family transcriptional regulator, cyclic AMP receptor protein
MAKPRAAFNPKTFLSTDGPGRVMLLVHRGNVIFAQGEPADALFVIQTGSVKLCAKSQGGKEATLDILSDADFVGKDAIAGQRIRTTSASALTDCKLLRIEKEAMMLALAQEAALSNTVCAYVLARNIRYLQELVDHRCNSSEKRLARVLLLRAQLDAQGLREAVIPKINQTTLAELVGTTRSRISFFLNRFKESGFIHYETKSEQMRVRRTLLDFYAQ